MGQVYRAEDTRLHRGTSSTSRSPLQLMHFPEDEYRIEDFEWSPDGKRLAFSRSLNIWDIVLFRAQQ